MEMNPKVYLSIEFIYVFANDNPIWVLPRGLVMIPGENSLAETYCSFAIRKQFQM